MLSYSLRQCQNDTCRFRFPVADGDVRGDVCPYCGTATTIISVEHTPSAIAHPAPRHTIELLLDNIRSAYNVGAIFRTADGAGVRRLHLGGITATPGHAKVHKTALGADGRIPWTHNRNALDTAAALKDQGYILWALEETPQAESLYTADLTVPDGRPLLLILGHEKTGVDPAILNLCHRILALPMLGHKNSLNVTVACGIALYHLQFTPK
ncbi:MAG TPA: TrmH family RNA methyltransferase [Anaerolineae bacterium]|nr:TrmH family RNA methyltransferase [Anaerolineae bacterium]